LNILIWDISQHILVWNFVWSDRYSSENECLRRIVRETRRTKEITQGELAARLGVPQSWVSKVESGERLLAFVEVAKLSDALGIGLEDFCRRFLESQNDTQS